MKTESNELLGHMSEIYVIVDVYNGSPYLRESETAKAGYTFDEVVKDIASGQFTYGHKPGPVGVLLLNVAEGTLKDVSVSVAFEVANWIYRHAESKTDTLWHCPFLDAVWPKWQDGYMKEFDAETGYLDDCRFEGRYR